MRWMDITYLYTEWIKHTYLLKGSNSLNEVDDDDDDTISFKQKKQ